MPRGSLRDDVSIIHPGIYRPSGRNESRMGCHVTHRAKSRASIRQRDVSISFARKFPRTELELLVAIANRETNTRVCE